MNKATEFLERVVRDKVDLAPKDFKVIVDRQPSIITSTR
jgi:hypothetical protein